MEDLRSVVAHLNRLLAPTDASSRVDSPAGLLSGDLRREVERVVVATDLTDEVVEEAVGAGADLLVTLSSPPHQGLVGEDGRELRRLVQEDVSLYTGEASGVDLVAEAVAGILDLQQVLALQPQNLEEYAMLVVYTPEDNAEDLRQGLAHAGAGAMGDYTGCAWSVTGTGEFTPGSGADPTIGEVWTHEQVRERRLEMVVPLERIAQVTAALREVHPYEEPAFSFLATRRAPGRQGRGRVGQLPGSVTAGELAQILNREIPRAHIRLSAPAEHVHSVAVCSPADEGAIVAAADAGAQVLISSDVTSGLLRAAQKRGVGMLDVPRSRLAWPALPLLARKLAQATAGETEVIVSTSYGPSWWHDCGD